MQSKKYFKKKAKKVVRVERAKEAKKRKNNIIKAKVFRVELMDCCKNKEIEEERQDLFLKNGYVLPVLVKYCVNCCDSEVVKL